MELIHADSNFLGPQMLTEFDAYEVISGLGYKYLITTLNCKYLSPFGSQPINDGHYLYQA